MEVECHLLLLSRASRLSLFSRSLLLSFLSLLLSLLSSDVSRTIGGWFLFVLNSRGESFMPGSGMGGGGSGGKPWPANSIKLCGPAIGPSGPIGPMPAKCVSWARKTGTSGRRARDRFIRRRGKQMEKSLTHRRHSGCRHPGEVVGHLARVHHRVVSAGGERQRK